MVKKVEKLRIDDTFYETEIHEEFNEKRKNILNDPHEIRAIIPGSIAEIKVKEGQSVVPGQVVIVLEAMKMLNDLESEIAGKVAEVKVTVGNRVEKHQLLIRLKNKD